MNHAKPNLRPKGALHHAHWVFGRDFPHFTHPLACVGFSGSMSSPWCTEIARFLQFLIAIADSRNRTMSGAGPCNATLRCQGAMEKPLAISILSRNFPAKNSSLVDISDIHYFSAVRGGEKGGSVRAGGGGFGFTENRRGGYPRMGGGGQHIFFGAEIPTKNCFCGNIGDLALAMPNR